MLNARFMRSSSFGLVATEWSMLFMSSQAVVPKGLRIWFARAQQAEVRAAVCRRMPPYANAGPDGP